MSSAAGLVHYWPLRLSQPRFSVAKRSRIHRPCSRPSRWPDSCPRSERACSSSCLGGDQFTFSLSGPGVYEAFYEIRDDLAEVHRRLAYDLLRFWETNDGHLKPLFRAYRAGALALVVQILALVALVSGSIF